MYQKIKDRLISRGLSEKAASRIAEALTSWNWNEIQEAVEEVKNDEELSKHEKVNLNKALSCGIHPPKQ